MGQIGSVLESAVLMEHVISLRIHDRKPGHHLLAKQCLVGVGGDDLSPSGTKMIRHFWQLLTTTPRTMTFAGALEKGLIRIFLSTSDPGRYVRYICTVAAVDQNIADEMFSRPEKSRLCGVLLPESQEQLSGPFMGINGQNWLFTNQPAMHAQIFINDAFHPIHHHVKFGGELPN
jgi:hypothetical protein